MEAECRTYLVTLQVSFSVDAPTADEAGRYGEIFVLDALAHLCREGCDPGEGFDAGTGVASGPDGFRAQTESSL